MRISDWSSDVCPSDLHLPAWLADFNRLEAGSLKPHLYRYQQNDAVRHAFRVASGLDSMVLGEPQILGQMNDRSEERRVGKECVSQGRSRWSPVHYKKKPSEYT